MNTEVSKFSAKTILRGAITVFLVCLSALPAFSLPTSAQSNQLTVVKKADLKLELPPDIPDAEFQRPDKILLGVISPSSKNRISSEEWYKGLYYYFSSERFNFKDLPIHYVVDGQGSIYEGVQGGVERAVLVENQPGKHIVVWYLAEQQATDFNSDAQASLQSLLSKLANENNIKAENVSLQGMKLQIDSEQKTANLLTEQLFGSWSITFNKIQDYLRTNYRPVTRQYSVSIEDFKSPAETVKAGSVVTVDFKIKNNSDYSIFSSDDSEILFTTENGKSSELFLNDSWVTKSQAPVIPEGIVIRPGGEASVALRVSVPLVSGKIGETFVVQNGFGQTVSATKFRVELNVDRSGIQILQITNTETGSLNVRQNPSSNATVVGKVSPGEKMIWTEQNNSGWYKVRFDGREGWILGKYAKVI